MPPKPVKKTAAAEKPVEIPIGAKLGFGGFIFAMLAILFYVTRESEMSRVHAELVRNFGISGPVQVQRGVDGAPILVSKANIQQGQPVLSIPAKYIVDSRGMGESPVGRFFRTDNGTVVNAVAQENNMSPGGFTLMSFALFFALEKRKGSASEFAPFFSLLPAQLTTALSWPEELLVCLDPASKGEHQMQLRSLNATVAAVNILCDSDAGVEIDCRGKPLSRDELAWGMAVYLQHNFQDQAFIPVLSFARYDNSKAGLTPQFDQETNTLHFTAQAPIERGEEVTLSYLRGPHAFYAAFSKFDENSRGVEVTLQLPEDEATKAVCQAHFADLQFGANGRPREALVNCLAVLVAPPELKPKLAKNMRKYRNPIITAHLWGNMTQVVNMFRDDKIDDEACRKVPQSPVVDAAREYTAWRRKVLDSNSIYAQQQASAKYDAAGIPTPVAQPPIEAEPSANSEESL